MAITYKDIDLLTQKASIAGTEKLPVSATEYITPAQIAASVDLSGKQDVIDSTHKLSYTLVSDTPTISTNVKTDKASDTKTSSPKSVYDEIHPALGSSQPAGGFLPNVIYDLGTLTGSVTFSLATPSDNTIANPYHWTFETGSTAPTVTWPSSLVWLKGSAPTISASKHYEILVRNGYASHLEWSLS